MAAAEYLTPGASPPREQQNSGLYAPPQPQRANSSQPGFGYQSAPPGRPSPQFGGGVQPSSPYPPPYQPLNNEPKVHFAQASQPSLLGQHRPSLSSQPTYALNQPNYQASQGQQLSPYPPGPYVPGGPYHQQQPTAQPHYRPHHRSTQNDLSRSGYSSDPEHHRHKHKNRPRRVSDNSRSTNADGFLGAAGGSLIGDLIFPGLGTVGGALVGWLGGKDYGKHRKWREEKRDREQDQWDRKYRRDSGSDRSRSHSWDNRDRNTNGQRYSHVGHDGIVHSHAGRRKSYD